MQTLEKDAWLTWVILGGIILVCAYGCQPKLEERDDYIAGYDAGLEAGYANGKNEMCDQIQTRLNDGAAIAVGC